MKGSFLGRLYKNRFQSEGELRQVLEAEAAAERQRSASTSCVGKRYHYIRGIYKGNFFRIKAPESTGILSRRIPRLRNHANPAMRPFLHPEQVKGHAKTPPGVTADALVSQTEMAAGGYWERVRWWWKHNWAVLVLNLGSVCSLLAFTRSDVLELRSLSVTGTVSALIYNLALPAEQRSLTPILWSKFTCTRNECIDKQASHHLLFLHDRSYIPGREWIQNLRNSRRTTSRGRTSQATRRYLSVILSASWRHSQTI